MVRNNKSTQVLAERQRAQRTSKVEVSEQIPPPHTQQKGYAEEIKKKKKSIVIFTSQTGQFMGTRLVSVFLDFFYVMSESSCSLVTNAAHD